MEIGATVSGNIDYFISPMTRVAFCDTILQGDVTACMNIEHQPVYDYDTYVYFRLRKLCGWKFKPCVSVYRNYYYNNYVYHITTNAVINMLLFTFT